METWLQRIFLSSLLCGSVAVSAQQAPVQIEPQIDRTAVTEDKLDDESLSIGLRGGLVSLNDFGTSGLAQAQLGYQITEDFFLTVDYDKAKAGLTSFEKLSGAAPLLTDAQRQWSFLGGAIGYVLMPGEVYFGSDYAMNSRWAIFAGAGTVDFAGDKVFGVQAGTNYQVYLTDYLAAEIQLTDYVYETTILAETTSQHSLALSLGLSVYF